MLLLLLIPIWYHSWSLHSPPVRFLVRSHENQGKVLGYFQTPQAAGRFWGPEMFLGTSATAWALHRLSKTWRIKARLQAGMSWEMVSGQWEVSRALRSSSYFHPPKGPSGVWYTKWELWSSRHAVIIPGSNTMGCQAYLHVPAMWVLMLSWWWQRGIPTRWPYWLWKAKQS